MKIISIVLLCSVSAIFIESCSYCNYDGPIDFKLVKNEIETFIEKIKNDSLERADHYVYLVSASYLTDNEYCISMSYIMDSLYVSEVNKYPMTFKVDNEIVLFRAAKQLYGNCKFPSDYVKYGIDEEKIKSKIFNDSYIIGIFKGSVFCISGDSIVSNVFYDDRDEIDGRYSNHPL